jgi:hypothetical protein
MSARIGESIAVLYVAFTLKSCKISAMIIVGFTDRHGDYRPAKSES